MHSHNERMIAFNIVNALNNEHIALKYFTIHSESTMNTCSYTFIAIQAIMGLLVCSPQESADNHKSAFRASLFEWCVLPIIPMPTCSPSALLTLTHERRAFSQNMTCSLNNVCLPVLSIAICAH